MRRLWEDFKAWRRGEERIAPKNVRGRVYQRKNEPVPEPAGNARARATATCEIKITRADGRIEHVQVPVEVSHG